jgi:hypothetical protein
LISQRKHPPSSECEGRTLKHGGVQSSGVGGGQVSALVRDSSSIDACCRGGQTQANMAYGRPFRPIYPPTPIFLVPFSKSSFCFLFVIFKACVEEIVWVGTCQAHASTGLAATPQAGCR